MSLLRRLILTGALVALPLLAAPVASAQSPRVFGVYVDPWHVPQWSQAVGTSPTMVGRFEAFNRGRSLDPFFAETARQGVRRVLLALEPWRPVPAVLGAAAQRRPQPGYGNAEIAAGSQDAYLLTVARSIAAFPGVVYVRYAAEMNGRWYPWSHSARDYRRAWRHVHRLFTAAGVRNVRWMWSPTLNPFQRKRAFKRSLRHWWPGHRWVGVVGATVVNYGGHKHYSVARLAKRLRVLHRMHPHKPIALAETNTAARGRVTWMRRLRRFLRRSPWVRMVAWCQLTSRVQAQDPRVGRLDWDVRTDPRSAAVLRRIVADGARRR
jgi:hypothetical protein